MPSAETDLLTAACTVSNDDKVTAPTTSLRLAGFRTSSRALTARGGQASALRDMKPSCSRGALARAPPDSVRSKDRRPPSYFLCPRYLAATRSWDVANKGRLLRPPQGLRLVRRSRWWNRRSGSRKTSWRRFREAGAPDTRAGFHALLPERRSDTVCSARRGLRSPDKAARLFRGGTETRTGLGRNYAGHRIDRSQRVRIMRGELREHSIERGQQPAGAGEVRNIGVGLAGVYWKPSRPSTCARLISLSNKLPSQAEP